MVKGQIQGLIKGVVGVKRFEVVVIDTSFVWEMLHGVGFE
jgi:hypothetical protein